MWGQLSEAVAQFGYDQESGGTILPCTVALFLKIEQWWDLNGLERQEPVIESWRHSEFAKTRPRSGHDSGEEP